MPLYSLLHQPPEEKSKARDEIATTQTNNRQTNHHGDKRSNSAAFHDFRKNASSNWNTFYDQNKTNFFKDRHYLHKAFPNEFGWLYNNDTVSSHEDATAINENYGEEDDDVDDGNVNAHDNVSKASSLPPPVGNDGIIRIVEIGCGVGNAILPLLEQHTELMKKAKEDQQEDNPLPQLHIHCLDFAPTAIQLLKEDARFQYAAKENRATGHVYDLSSMHPSTIYIGNKTDANHDAGSTTTRRQEVLANSSDVAILLFCLSAIGPHPSPSLSRAAQHAIDMLRPGGTLVIRDYGRLDEGTNEVCVFLRYIVCDNVSSNCSIITIHYSTNKVRQG